MPEINIKVCNKCAEGEGVIICNNSDYTVVWDLDEEWTPYDTKTMRVNLADGTYQDVVFPGNTAVLPVLSTPGWASVGLYAGDIRTTRAARLLALSSVLTPGGAPAAPAEDVYAQIMAKLNELSTVSPEDIAKAVEDYLAEHPAASASMRVEGGYIQFSGDGKTWENVIALADLKGPKGDTGAGMDVTGATVGQIAKISEVDDSGVPTAWEPADMPGGGGEKSWTKIIDVEITERTHSFIADNLGGATEFHIRWSNLQNESQTDSGLNLVINGKEIGTAGVGSVVAKAGVSRYGWTHCKYTGLFWLIEISGGSISSGLNSRMSLNSVWNLTESVGEATTLKLRGTTDQYSPVSGKLEVWAR
jgi:hypothetical protein|uniref:Uncharacterized protein n=1 Tax=Siphoviridae sp. ctCNm48 TaxID=2825377 RepID=A0A8S5TW79_9CAUD|nr:MAG TPA: hypothetical protein [Siphoviridae sp. ctCNm48]